MLYGIELNVTEISYLIPIIRQRLTKIEGSNRKQLKEEYIHLADTLGVLVSIRDEHYNKLITTMRERMKG